MDRSKTKFIATFIAVLTAIVGLINLISAVTPGTSDR